MNDHRRRDAANQHFLSVSQFCEQFQVGKTRAYALMNAGTIEAVKHGARTLIKVESARRWAASLPPFGSAR